MYKNKAVQILVLYIYIMGYMFHGKVVSTTLDQILGCRSKLSSSLSVKDTMKLFFAQKII